MHFSAPKLPLTILFMHSVRSLAVNANWCLEFQTRMVLLLALLGFCYAVARIEFDIYGKLVVHMIDSLRNFFFDNVMPEMVECQNRGGEFGEAVISGSYC